MPRFNCYIIILKSSVVKDTNKYKSLKYKQILQELERKEKFQKG